jgi:hypothetical protein
MTMETNLLLLLQHAEKLRAAGVLRVRCGDFEAELAPLAERAPEQDAPAKPYEEPRRRTLRQIVGRTDG